MVIVFIICLVTTTRVKKLIPKKAKVSSESEEEENPLLRVIKKKTPSQLSQSSTKVIATRKIVPKSKPPIKVKPTVLESDDNSPPPNELKTKSSVFDRLGVGDVSSTTPNFDSNNAPTTESRKVTEILLFYMLLNVLVILLYLFIIVFSI